MPFKPRSDEDFPSLGWDIIDEWYRLFPSPRNELEPFLLTDVQALEIVEWYRVHPVTGKFIYRRGCSRKAKKTGKSPLEAAKCITELAMPCKFDGWDANGQPVARPWGTGGLPTPWVQIASNSEDQDDNTWKPMLFFLTANHDRLADELGIDPGLTRCLLRRQKASVIEPVTSRAGSREGQPVTYGCLDETGLMRRENGGVKLAETVRRNCTGMGGRTYETTNGFMPGEESVAERTHRSIENGRTGIFYSALEAPTVVDGVEVTEDAPDHILRKALETPYTGCWWNDLDRIVADIRDDDMPWPQAERFFFNWNRKGEGKAVDPKRWDELARPARTPTPDRRTRIVVFFDGSQGGTVASPDDTVLVGWTVDESPHLFLIDWWAKPEGVRGEWLVPRREVRARVSELREEFDVVRFVADPPYWRDEIMAWEMEFGLDAKGDPIAIEYPTNQPKRMDAAIDRFLEGVAHGNFTQDGTERLRFYALNALLGVSAIRGNYRALGKPADRAKIDGLVAAVGGYDELQHLEVVEPVDVMKMVW